MFEIGWTELLVIGVVALIVIGPKDLPEMFRQIGRFTGKMRSMARDFQRAMDQAANETGLKDVARDLKSAGSMKPTAMNAVKQAASKFEKWDPLQNAARPTTPVAATSAAMAASAAGSATVGPETQALLDAQAKRQAIVAETTERLRAVAAKPAPVVLPTAGSTTVAGTTVETATKPARKPRAKSGQADSPAASPAPDAGAKPKKPRKSASKAGEA